MARQWESADAERGGAHEARRTDAAARRKIEDRLIEFDQLVARRWALLFPLLASALNARWFMLGGAIAALREVKSGLGALDRRKGVPETLSFFVFFPEERLRTGKNPILLPSAPRGTR